MVASRARQTFERGDLARTAEEALRTTPVAVLALALVLSISPLWSTYLEQLPIVTVGRGALFVLAVIGAKEVISRRRRSDQLPVLFFVVLAALALLVVGSVAMSGCACQGGAQGLMETMALIAIAAIIGTFHPEYSRGLLGAAAVGVALASILALLGIEELHSTLGTSSAHTSRISGIYGNPNVLAFAIASVLPILFVGIRHTRGAVRIVAAAVLVLEIVVLTLTFSRAGLLAACGGLFATLVIQTRRRRPNMALILTSVIVIIGVAIVAYPRYADFRIDAEFGNMSSTLRARDLSGWDGTAQGLIPHGNTSLTNPAGSDVLRVDSTKSGQGVSFPLHFARQGVPQALMFHARTEVGATMLRFGMEDNFEGNNPTTKSARIGTRWERLNLVWTPTADSPAARLYIWQESGRGTFLLADVSVSSGRDRVRASERISTRLLGSQYDKNDHWYNVAEEAYIESRWEALQLAWAAFSDHPFDGIGWERFPRYAQRHGSFGEMATHNEYLRFAAELGVFGVVLMILVGAMGLTNLRWAAAAAFDAAAAGVIVAGAVGLAFMNALGVTSASASLAVALGLSVARRKRHHLTARTPPDRAR
jgi:hypothetical protein